MFSILELLKIGGILLFVIFFILYKMSRIERKSISVIHIIVSILFVTYTFFVFKIVGIPSIRDVIDGNYLMNISLIPFIEFSYMSQKSVWYNIIGNLLLFIPLGMLLPCLSPRYKNIFRTVAFGAVTSLLIECSQLFTLYRVTDIDDLIVNTIGSLVGYLLYWVLRVVLDIFSRNIVNTLDWKKVNYKKLVKRSFIIKHEAALYIVIVYIVYVCIYSI